MNEKSDDEKKAEAQAAAQALAEEYHAEVTVSALDADGNVLASFTGTCRCPDCEEQEIPLEATRE